MLKPALSVSCAAAFLALVTSTAAVAQNLGNMQVASNLGTLLAAEEFCGLVFDHDAIDAYVDANVDHSDMGFASMLSMMVDGSAFGQTDMSESAKRAHCRSVEATARHHGFID